MKASDEGRKPAMKWETLCGEREGSLVVEGSRFKYGEIEGDFSITPLDAGCYSVVLNGRSFLVARTPKGELYVKGKAIAIEVFDPRSLRSRGKGGGAHGRQNVTAPMPGKVIRVLVSVGDTVEAGQGLVVVEAMKMQNEMKSPKAGRIAEIKTKAEAAVSAGDVLVVVE